MDQTPVTQQTRIREREAAFRLLNRITTGIAFGSVGAVAALGIVTANTIPGTPWSSQTAGASTSSAVASSASGTSSSGTASSSGVTSTSSQAVAVSGGSHP